jgi:hypothetical protein
MDYAKRLDDIVDVAEAALRAIDAHDRRLNHLPLTEVTVLQALVNRELQLRTSKPKLP